MYGFSDYSFDEVFKELTLKLNGKLVSGVELSRQDDSIKAISIGNIPLGSSLHCKILYIGISAEVDALNAVNAIDEPQIPYEIITEEDEKYIVFDIKNISDFGTIITNQRGNR